MRRSSLMWGAALLLLGGLMLADSAGIRLPGGARPLNFFWPLVLILLGAWMILGVMMRRSVTAEQASVDLQGASEASVQIDHGAGELLIAGGAGMGQLASGTFAGGLEQSSHRNGERLDVKMNPPLPTFMIVPNFDRYDWDLRMNSEVPMTLNLHMGANKATVDLSDMLVRALKVETGASQAEVTLPKRGRMRAEFSLGAASLTVRVPDGMAARIKASHGASSLRVDEVRFPRTGEYYQSPGYDTAENAAEIKIDAGAADIRVQ